MVRTMLSAAFAAAVTLAPAQAQDLGDIVGGVARQYLQQEQDRAAFAQAQSADTLSAYQSYLRQFPNGAYAEQARDRVQRLGGGTGVVPTNPSQTDTAGLSRQQRAQIQRQLNGLGYSTNGADGNFGPGTRRAIALWQRDRNYAQTGTLNATQANEILQGTAATRPSTTAPAVGPAGTEADLGLNRQQRQAVQAGLTQRGFDTRGLDGVFGRGTRNALAAWQRANDMEATGYLTAAQYDRLVGR
ncbi:peptidoglycan-binding protein [Paracoccus sp. S3-43]|uniref:peptidoglycan-binding domain-containing protein n=1 Tax=Paracoccus sp. S3-43 TaxID=3030011 RepID=UPI0023B1CEA4|nr:peptidoglycan-binding protein [Paracoccus sp. S3-43]WEF25202.1 peptidoglycan-binding domain-containing protein [Paracoccus sp. S3-43]